MSREAQWPTSRQREELVDEATKLGNKRKMTRTQITELGLELFLFLDKKNLLDRVIKDIYNDRLKQFKLDMNKDYDQSSKGFSNLRRVALSATRRKKKN